MMRRAASAMLIVVLILSSFPRQPTAQADSIMACSSYIYNGSFRADLGAAGWQHRAGDGTICTSAAYYDAPYSVRLGAANDADDWLWQAVQLPAGITSVQLDFYFASTTSDTYPESDFFRAGIADSSFSQELVPTFVLDNASSYVNGQWWRYTSPTYAFSPHSGRSVIVFFNQETDYSYPTATYVDVISLIVCSGTAAPTATATPTRTGTRTPTQTTIASTPTRTATVYGTFTPTRTPRQPGSPVFTYLPVIVITPQPTTTPTATLVPTVTPTVPPTDTPRPPRDDR